MATFTVDTCRRRFSVKETISHCFIKTVDHTNAFAAHSLLAPNKYFIIFLMGFVFAQEILGEVLAIKEIRILLGIHTRKKKYGGEAEVACYKILRSTAFQWLCWHELGHIKNEHLHLGVVQSKGVLQSEMMQISEDEDQNRTSHALEMDADSFASTQILPWLLKVPADTLFEGATVPLFKNEQTKLVCFILALYLMLRQFDSPSWSTRTLFRFSHPPAFVRIMQILFWCETFLSSSSSFVTKPDEALRLGRDVILAVEDALFVKSERAFPSDAFSFFGEGRWSSYSDSVLARYAKVRPELKLHLLGGTLAPAQIEPS